MNDAAIFSPTSGPSAGSGEPTTPPVRRLRGRRMSGRERAVLFSMLGIACLLGALSAGAPTGHAAVDAVYRALYVGTMALAASRARRWALVVGSAIAAVASIGVGLLFAAAALVMTVVLVARQLRNRAYGACIGAFVAMACLRLEVGGFVGSETLVAVAASLPLLWSGYRVSTRTTRRTIRWVLATAGLIAVVAVGMAGYQALNYTSSLSEAVTSTTRGISGVRSGDTAIAARQFVTASEEFDAVAQDAGRWYWFPTRLVPVLSQNLATVPTVSEAGRSLTETAARTAGKVDYRKLRREGGGVDLALLDEYREPVLEVVDRLRTVTDDVDDLRTPWLLGPLSERLDDFDAKVADLRRESDIAALAVQYGPAIFGGEGERRYLVLLGNPAEARDLGGHIGNFVELSMNDGVLQLERVGVPRELGQPGLDDEFADSGLAPPSMVAMRPATYAQNWGTAVDFPTDAAVAARLYAAKVGRPIDGVMYVDPYALAQLLAITGPIELPELRTKISAKNAVQFLTVDQYSAFPDQQAADDALTGFVRTLFDELTRTTLPAPTELGKGFSPLVKAGRFRFASTHDADRGLLRPLGLDLGFGPTEGDDLLAVISRNANPSKIDAFLHRTTEAEVTWDPETGGVRTVVTVTLRNDAPAAGLPAYVIGNGAGLPSGTNLSDLSVLTPFEATRATVDGVDAPVSPLWDGDHWRHTVRVRIAPGATVTVRFELEGDVDVGDRYRLHFAGQPLVNEGTVRLRVTSTDARDDIVDGPGIEVNGPTATAELSDVGRADLTLRRRS